MAKKLLFYCDLSSGHLNVAISLAKTILKLHGDKFEVWFLTNEEYKEFIKKRIEKAKFLIYSFHLGEEGGE